MGNYAFLPYLRGPLSPIYLCTPNFYKNIVVPLLFFSDEKQKYRGLKWFTHRYGESLHTEGDKYRTANLVL